MIESKQLTQIQITKTSGPIQTSLGIPCHSNLKTFTNFALENHQATTSTKVQQALQDTQNSLAQELSNPPLKLQAHQSAIQGIQKISERSDLSPKQKKQMIKGLGKQMGLSRSTLRKITKWISSVYKKHARQLQAFQQSQLQSLNQEQKQLEALYGKNSPEVQAVQQRKNLLTSLMQSQIEKYSEQSKFYKKLFPKRGFFSKLGGMFKKVGGFLKKVPVVGKAVSAIESLGKGIGSLVQGKLNNFLQHTTGFLSKALPLATKFFPGIGPVVGSILEKVNHFMPSQILGGKK